MKIPILLVATLLAFLSPFAVEAEENGAEGEFMFLPPDTIFVWDMSREDGSQVCAFDGFLAPNAGIYRMSGSIFLPLAVDSQSPDPRAAGLKSYSGQRVLLYASFHTDEEGKRIIDGLLIMSLPKYRAVGRERAETGVSKAREDYIRRNIREGKE